MTDFYGAPGQYYPSTPTVIDPDVHVAITQQFIDENPSQVSIRRSPRVSDGAGGWVAGAEVTLPDQKMRLVGIEPRRGQTLLMVVTRDGEQVVANSTIIAMPTADIKNQDQFILNGNEDDIYEVLHVESHPEWRIRAEVYLNRE